jgi:hypothetical protein
MVKVFLSIADATFFIKYNKEYRNKHITIPNLNALYGINEILLC